MSKEKVVFPITWATRVQRERVAKGRKGYAKAVRRCIASYVGMAPGYSYSVEYKDMMHSLPVYWPKEVVFQKF